MFQLRFREPFIETMSSASQLQSSCSQQYPNAKVKNAHNAVHIVLAHLCQELGKPIADDHDDNQVERDDVEIFEQMLAYDV